MEARELARLSLFASASVPGMIATTGIPPGAVVPVTEDGAHLYETWVGMGGEGIVLKDLASRYWPGERPPAWLKLNPRSPWTRSSRAALLNGSRGVSGARRSCSTWNTRIPAQVSGSRFDRLSASPGMNHSS
jgi:hypothetical protein